MSAIDVDRTDERAADSSSAVEVEASPDPAAASIVVIDIGNALSEESMTSEAHVLREGMTRKVTEDDNDSIMETTSTSTSTETTTAAESSGVISVSVSVDKEGRGALDALAALASAAAMKPLSSVSTPSPTHSHASMVTPNASEHGDESATLITETSAMPPPPPREVMASSTASSVAVAASHGFSQSSLPTALSPPPPPPRLLGRLRSASNPEGMEKWDSYSRNDRLHFVLPSSILEEELASTRMMLGEREHDLSTANTAAACTASKSAYPPQQSQDWSSSSSTYSQLNVNGGESSSSTSSSSALGSLLCAWHRPESEHQSQQQLQHQSQAYNYNALSQPPQHRKPQQQQFQSHKERKNGGVLGTSPDSVANIIGGSKNNHHQDRRHVQVSSSATAARAKALKKYQPSEIKEELAAAEEEEDDESLLEPEELLRRARARLLEDLSQGNASNNGRYGRDRSNSTSSSGGRTREGSIDIQGEGDGEDGAGTRGCAAEKGMPTLPHSLAKYKEVYNKNGRIGIYTPAERAAIIGKFHAKRARRVWNKKIRYNCRKNLADRRMRVKGRFVKRSVEAGGAVGGGRSAGVGSGGGLMEGAEGTTVNVTAVSFDGMAAVTARPRAMSTGGEVTFAAIDADGDVEMEEGNSHASNGAVTLLSVVSEEKGALLSTRGAIVATKRGGKSSTPPPTTSGSTLYPVDEEGDDEFMTQLDVEDEEAGFRPTEEQPYRRTRRHTIT